MSAQVRTPTRRDGDLPPRRGEVCEERRSITHQREDRSANSPLDSPHSPLNTPLPLDEHERWYEEICSVTRDVRRRIVESEQWKQAVAEGLIPEHLLAAAAELDAAQALESG